MTNEILMPQMGESITNGTITKWHKKPGDIVEADEILLEISTDKVESEIPSPIKGRIASILFEEGETVDVGIKIAEIQDDITKEFIVTSETIIETKAPQDKQEEKKGFYTPLVKKLAKDAKVSLEELDSIQGTGAGGRVTKEDFENYLKTKTSVKAPTPAPKYEAPPQTPKNHGDRVEIIPMDNMRKTIAKNMVLSKTTSPHVNSMSEVDLTHLVKFRESYKNEFFAGEGFKLTYTPFIMKAIIQALKEFPLVNSSVDGDNIVMKKDINLGFAVAVPGNGLVVPVIKNADTLNMLGLCRAVDNLATRARAKKLTADELSGGTFTFTNVGTFGTILATPVILQPQVGIYAAGLIQKRVVVTEDDAIAVRSMMYGTHTFDHRLIDGQVGGEFLEAVHRHLRDMVPEDLF